MIKAFSFTNIRIASYFTKKLLVAVGAVVVQVRGVAREGVAR